MALSVLINSLVKFRGDLLSYIESREILNLITELKRDELSQGKTGSGSDISPKYSEVPGFKDWYNEWKKKNIPTYKLDDVPDLYIDGTFYASLDTKFEGVGIYKTDTDYSKPFMADVMQMHDKGDLLDLTKGNIDQIANMIEAYVLSYNL